VGGASKQQRFCVYWLTILDRWRGLAGVRAEWIRGLTAPV
jgi:hypothetical protein